MKKICLFSRKHDDYEFIKVSNHFNDLEIKYVLFPTDDIKDKSTIFNYEIASYNDFGKILCKVDYVIFGKSFDKSFSDIEELILLSLNEKKEVYCLCQLEEKNLKKIKDYSKHNDLIFKYYDEYSDYNNLNEKIVPTLGIFCLHNDDSILELHLKIKNLFIKKNIISYNICCSKYSTLFDMKIFPESIMELNCNDIDRNRLLKEYFLKTNQQNKNINVISFPPDRDSNIYPAKYYTDFAVKHFMKICDGIDFSILVLPFYEYGEYNLESIKTSFFNNYSVKINALVLTNNMIDSFNRDKNRTDLYIEVSNDKVRNYLKKSNYKEPVFSLDENDLEVLVDQIINFLR